MFKPASLNALFSLLEEMTQTNRVYNVVQPSPRMRRFENWLVVLYITTVALLIIAAVIQKFAALPAYISRVAMVLYAAFVLLGLTYLVTTSISIGVLLWRNRKQPFAVQLSCINLDLHDDARYLTQLHAHDRKTLEYGLLQYRHRWDISDGRIALLAGDLRKLGLFPALTAASMSASALLKSDSNLYLWLPLIVASCFYFLAFHAKASRERPHQVIALLQYAIDHSEVKPDHALAHAESVTGRALDGESRETQNTPRSTIDTAAL